MAELVDSAILFEVDLQMKKRLLPLGLMVLLIFACACNTGKDVSTSVDVSAITELEGLDNSIDKYSSILHEAIKTDSPDGAIEGGNEDCLLGKDKVLTYKAHLFEDYEACYDEVSIVDCWGQKASVRLNGSSIIRVGNTGDSDGFFALTVGMEDDIYQYSLTRYSIDGSSLETIALPFLDSETFTSSIYVTSDATGTIFAAKNNLQKSTCEIYVLSEDGEVVLEEILNNHIFYDYKLWKEGETTFVVGSPLGEDGKYTYYSFDKETNMLIPVCEHDKQYLYRSIFYTDSDNIVYAGNQGVFLLDSDMEISEECYLWENHDIRVSAVRDVTLFDNKISVLYENESGNHYIILQPTDEYVDVKTIQFAVPQSGRSKYASAVYLFNSTHPSCRIEMVDTFDEASLITEITSGKGPVLISSEVIDFASHANYWEPLDDVYDKLGIYDELNEAAVRLGSINGQLYGIVSDFAIETMVTGCKNPEWNYERFIDEINNVKGLLSIAGSGYDETSVATYIFDHGMDDSFYIDKETKEPLFDTDEFRTLMLLIKEKAYKENGDTFEEKRVYDCKDLCNAILITKPETLILYKRLYGDDVKISGFPGNDGPVNFLHSMATITIRKNATKEEKEIAFAFANTILSYDAQISLTEGISSGMSVRKDVFEKRVAQVKKGSTAYIGIRGKMEIDDTPDNEANKNKLDELIRNSVPGSFTNDEYKSILFDEFQSYFSGAITLDKLVDNLSSRIGIYIKEHQ